MFSFPSIPRCCFPSFFPLILQNAKCIPFNLSLSPVLNKNHGITCCLNLSQVIALLSSMLLLPPPPPPPVLQVEWLLIAIRTHAVVRWCGCRLRLPRRLLLLCFALCSGVVFVAVPLYITVPTFITTRSVTSVNPLHGLFHSYIRLMY